MLISELNWSVDSPTFLGDIKFNLQLLLNQIITEIFKFKQTYSLKYCSFTHHHNHQSPCFCLFSIESSAGNWFKSLIGDKAATS